MTEAKQIEIQAKWKQLENARSQLRSYLGEGDRDFGMQKNIVINLGDYTVTGCFDMDQLRQMRDQAIKTIAAHVKNLEEEYALL